MALVIYAGGAPVTCAVCVQEWNEKYTALKTLFMILKFSLIGMWQYGNENVHLSNISFKLQSLSQGQPYVIIFRYPGQDLRS